MRNRMYGGVRGRKTKVERKLLRFPPTRFTFITQTVRNLQTLCIYAHALNKKQI